MNVILSLIVILIWLTFAVYWAVSWLYEKATRTEKPVQKATSSLSFWLIRILVVALAIFLTANGGISALNNTVIPYYLPLAVAGTAILACGIGFAIWARRTLSTNWSGIIVLKKGQTLTKTGPYRIVRHPIYTGLFFGALGTFLAVDTIITLIFAFGVLLFVLNRVRIEEKLMLEKFGKQYVQYQKGTKKLIPFIY
jgi:protein-S-isoprenylcysteine O-methyltransferase Ste14